MGKINTALRGFTLVELLIVVAIIGILSTVGIPTYRRMIQKAKQSEAKVMLGGIFTVESAFFSEWGAYGTNLSFMGFSPEGLVFNGSISTFVDVFVNGKYIYALGFFGASCQTLGTGPMPSTFLPAGQRLNARHPGYFNRGAMVYLVDAAQWKSSYCRPSDFFEFLAGGYEATATGAIAQGVDPLTSNASLLDEWTINHKRELVNASSGVQ